MEEFVMVMNTKQRQLKPYHGIILFALVLVFLLFGAAPIQMRLGMGGVALTEIILLAMALIPAILLKADLKEMFPIKRPKIRQVIGVVLIWFGTFLLGTLVTLIVGFFFPDGMAEVGIAMNDIFTSIPMWIAYLIIAVMPAICEEALHRGFIQTTMKPIRREWVIVLVMGLIFGIFHLDPYRFAATAILGMALTYVMLKTRNILMPAFFHLINNSLSVIVSFATANSLDTMEQTDTSAVFSSGLGIGSYMILGAAIPFLILAGVVLLRDKITATAPMADAAAVPAAGALTEQTPEQIAEQAAIQVILSKRKKFTVRALIMSGIISVLMIVGGVGIVAGSILSNPVLDHTESVSINSDTAPLVLSFEVAIPRSYLVAYDLSTERGLIDMTISDVSGKEIYNFSAAKIYGTTSVALEQGRYTVTFTFVQSGIEQYYEEHNMEYSSKVTEELGLAGDLTEYKTADIMVSIK